MTLCIGFSLVASFTLCHTATEHTTVCICPNQSQLSSPRFLAPHNQCIVGTRSAEMSAQGRPHKPVAARRLATQVHRRHHQSHGNACTSQSTLHATRHATRHHASQCSRHFKPRAARTPCAQLVQRKPGSQSMHPSMHAPGRGACLPPAMLAGPSRGGSMCHVEHLCT